MLTMQGGPPAYHVLAKPTGPICNLDCEYCFFLSKEMLYPGDRFRMADELLETYIQQLLESHKTPEVMVAWQGGEPTMMGLDFFRRSVELVDKHRKPNQQISYTIQTNGTRLDDVSWSGFVPSTDSPTRKLFSLKKTAQSVHRVLYLDRAHRRIGLVELPVQAPGGQIGGAPGTDGHRGSGTPRHHDLTAQSRARGSPRSVWRPQPNRTRTGRSVLRRGWTDRGDIGESDRCGACAVAQQDRPVTVRGLHPEVPAGCAAAAGRRPIAHTPAEVVEVPWCAAVRGSLCLLHWHSFRVGPCGPGWWSGDV